MVEEAAGIAAKVEHDATCAFVLQPFDTLDELGRRVLIELLERDVADLSVERDLVRHCGYANNRAGELHLDRRSDAASTVSTKREETRSSTWPKSRAPSVVARS